MLLSILFGVCHLVWCCPHCYSILLLSLVYCTLCLLHIFQAYSLGMVCAVGRTAEQSRLDDDVWRQWGPYLSERQWGTVREDHSHDGNWFVPCQHLANQFIWMVSRKTMLCQ